MKSYSFATGIYAQTYSGVHGYFHPFTPKSDQLQISPAVPQEITSHSIENLPFHSLLRWEMIILPILTSSLQTPFLPCATSRSRNLLSNKPPERIESKYCGWIMFPERLCNKSAGGNFNCPLRLLDRNWTFGVRGTSRASTTTTTWSCSRKNGTSSGGGSARPSSGRRKRWSPPPAHDTDVTSAGQRSSPWPCNSVKVEITFHVECNLRFLSAEVMLHQMHRTDLSASIEAKYWVSWQSLDVQPKWIWAIKTALNSLTFCAVTADSKSRWPHGVKAYFRSVPSRATSQIRCPILGWPLWTSTWRHRRHFSCDSGLWRHRGHASTKCLLICWFVFFSTWTPWTICGEGQAEVHRYPKTTLSRPGSKGVSSLNTRQQSCGD